MRGIVLEQLEVLFRYILNGFRERIEAPSESVCCPMHLQSLESSAGLLLQGFLH